MVVLTKINELNVKIGRVLGTVQLYSQNGSVRIALPRNVAKKLQINRFGGDDERRDSDDQVDDAPSFILLETSIGITICPLGTYTSLLRLATENSGLSDLA